MKIPLDFQGLRDKDKMIARNNVRRQRIKESDSILPFRAESKSCRNSAAAAAVAAEADLRREGQNQKPSG